MCMFQMNDIIFSTAFSANKKKLRFDEFLQFPYERSMPIGRFFFFSIKYCRNGSDRYVNCAFIRSYSVWTMWKWTKLCDTINCVVGSAQAQLNAVAFKIVTNKMQKDEMKWCARRYVRLYFIISHIQRALNTRGYTSRLSVQNFYNFVFFLFIL